jgi:serine/threonine-protein kinase HipA
MSVNGKFTEITRADLLAVAERFGIGSASKVLKQVVEAISSWHDFAKQSAVSPTEINRIAAHHQLL